MLTNFFNLDVLFKGYSTTADLTYKEMDNAILLNLPRHKLSKYLDDLIKVNKLSLKNITRYQRKLIELEYVALGNVLNTSTGVLLYDDNLAQSYVQQYDDALKQMKSNILHTYDKTGGAYQSSIMNDYDYINSDTNRLANGQTFTNFTDTLARQYNTVQSLSDMSSNMEYYGQDLVVVSGHGDPSPLCRPFQHGIYSLFGKTREYPLFNSILFKNRQDGQGIYHKYCRHFTDPYFEGDTEIKKPPYSAKGVEDRKATRYAEAQAYNHTDKARKYNNLATFYKDIDPDKALLYKDKALKSKALAKSWRKKVDDIGYNAHEYTTQPPSTTNVIIKNAVKTAQETTGNALALADQIYNSDKIRLPKFPKLPPPPALYLPPLPTNTVRAPLLQLEGKNSLVDEVEIIRLPNTTDVIEVIKQKAQE